MRFGIHHECSRPIHKQLETSRTSATIGGRCREQTKWEMSAVGQASQSAVWLFRALAMGSSVAAAAVVLPQLQASSCEQATQLAHSPEPLFAREGLRRMYYALSKNRCSVQRMVELGAEQIVRDGVRSEEKAKKKWAMRVAGLLVAGGMMDVLSCAGFEEVLGADGCDSNCEAFCEAAGLRDCSPSERRRLLREGSEHAGAGE